MSDGADAILERWLVHRNVSRELVRRVPPSAADFRPWAGAMSLGELVFHIATSHTGMTASALGRERPQAPAVDKGDLKALETLLEARTREDEAAIRALSSADLTALRPTRPGAPEQPAATILEGATDHEIHHKGQLFVYARMNGVDVPRWR